MRLPSGDRVLDRLARACTATSPRAYRIALCAVALIVGAEALLLGAIGAYHVNAYGHDTPVLLDAGWRMLQGQVPHADFHTSLGPVAFLPIVAAMRVLGPTADALGLASAALVIVLVGWAWAIARRRMSAALAAMFCLLVGGVVGGTHHLGGDIQLTTYGMVYNRLGYAILAIMLVELLLGRHDDSAGDLSAGISTGVLTALLLFLKITYFVAGVGAVAAACLLRLPRRRYWRWGAGFAAGALAAGLAFLAYLGWSPAPMLADLRLTFVARSSVGQTGLVPLLSAAVANLSAGVMLGITWFAMSGARADAPDAGAKAVRLLAAVIVVWGLGVALKATNYQGPEAPIYATMALVLLEYAGRAACGGLRAPVSA